YSFLPTGESGLTVGETEITVSSHKDNCYYNGDTSGTKLSVLAAVHVFDDWVCSDTDTYDLASVASWGGGAGFTIECKAGYEGDTCEDKTACTVNADGDACENGAASGFVVDGDCACDCSSVSANFEGDACGDKVACTVKAIRGSGAET
ncbi:hypothetical protein TeGR_g5486, partial [Tetraparma gracilis]